MRILTAIAVLCAFVCACLIVLINRRHERINDPRRASRGAVTGSKRTMTIAGLIGLILLAWTVAAHARPSPYPPVTQFNGDRYGAVQVAQRAAKTGREARGGQHRGARKAIRTRHKWRGVPFPAPRPIAEPGNVEPLSVVAGGWREARRAMGRPAAWCGWWLGQHLGMHDRSLWLARNWASRGSNAGGPAPGVVVVWRHHVGIITGRGPKGWIVRSGNDGHRVRERARSIAGAIAFRRV